MSALMRHVEQRARWAGGLIAAGLIVELGTLYWHQALSFIVFGGVSTVLAGTGILLYLYAMAKRPSP